MGALSPAPGLRSGSAVSLSCRVYISKKPPKGHKGDVAPVSYSLQPSEHILDGEAGWQHQAGTQAGSQKPGAWHSRLGVGGAGLSAMPGAKADLAATSPKHVPGLAGIPGPRTKSAPARSAAPAPGTGVRARRAGLAHAASQLQTPPRCRLGSPRLLRALTIVVDPGWLQELHCSAAAGLRPEPCPSARLGHGAAAASSRAARPPAAAHPSPQRRRAIAGPRPQPPPQPPPALGRRRRRHSRIPCAAPPPAAPGQRRKSRRAPAKSPRRETAPYADGPASALWQAGGALGYTALGLARARSLVRLGVDELGRGSRCRPTMRDQGSVQVSNSTSAAPSPL